MGWTNAVAELQGWLTQRREKMNGIPLWGDWGPPTGGLFRLHSLHPPIHTIVGDFSPWLTPDSPFLSFRLTKEAWTSLHALRPQLESWLGIRALVWLLHVDVDQARTVLSQICRDLENSTHPICEHIAVVAPCGVGMTHHGLTTPWVHSRKGWVNVSSPRIEAQVECFSGPELNRREAAEVWGIVRAAGGPVEEKSRAREWTTAVANLLFTASGEAQKILVPLTRSDGSWWGVPPLRSSVARKGTRGGPAGERDGQCGSAQLQCEVANAASNHGRALDREWLRLHPEAAMQGAAPYNYRVALRNSNIKAFEECLTEIRRELWTQERRRMKEHLLATSTREGRPGSVT